MCSPSPGRLKERDRRQTAGDIWAVDSGMKKVNRGRYFKNYAISWLSSWTMYSEGSKLSTLSFWLQQFIDILDMCVMFLFCGGYASCRMYTHAQNRLFPPISQYSHCDNSSLINRQHGEECSTGRSYCCLRVASICSSQSMTSILRRKDSGKQLYSEEQTLLLFWTWLQFPEYILVGSHPPENPAPGIRCPSDGHHGYVCVCVKQTI